MSSLSIAPYFPFRRMRIIDQVVCYEGSETHIDVIPDKRFRRVCHGCGARGIHTHSWTQRTVRDLELFEPYVRVTVRLARYMHEVCKLRTVKEVAEHLELDIGT